LDRIEKEKKKRAENLKKEEANKKFANSMGYDDADYE
jgi:hypothetical protein